MADDVYELDEVKMENNNEKQNEMSYFEEITYGKSGIKLYQWQYKPIQNTPRALLFITHGFGEHSKRYDALAKLFCSELGCVVISHDHVGHGKSEGERVIVNSFDVYVEDIFEHIDKVKKAYPKLPVYLFGGSMGATISILSACKRPVYFSAVVLCGPAILIHPNINPGRVLTFIGKIISRICPSMEILPPLNPRDVTTDEIQAQIYNDDPLSWHGGIKSRMAKVFGDAMNEIRDNLISTIQWPFLIVHGDDDNITYVGGAELLMQNAPSIDKNMKVYKGLKHDILHEVKDRREQVMNDIVEWFRQRIVT